MLIPEALYSQIIQVIPIPCVDLLVFNEHGEILMLMRKNEPAKGRWWFPGGRVNFMEERKDTAIRKLYEECGLKGKIIEEMGTFDLFLKAEEGKNSHAITTVFQIQAINSPVVYDTQSTAYAWKHYSQWLPLLDPFPREIINLYLKKMML